MSRALAALAPAAVWLLLLGSPASAFGQDRDAPEPAQGPAPASDSPPSSRSDWIERLLNRTDSRAKEATSGPYAWFGSILRGGWAAGGPGLRAPLGDRVDVDALAALSLKGYTLARASATARLFGERGPRIGLQAEVLNARAVAFYGVGNDSSEDDRTSYRLRPFTVGVTVAARPLPRLEVGAAVNRLSILTGPGSKAPAVEELFDGDEAPGLLESPRYLVFSAHAQMSPRPAKTYAPPGGTYRIGWSRFRRADSDSSSFHRLDLDLSHLVWVKPETWALAGRMAASTTYAADGTMVPYFLLPDLGGGSSLRSYGDWRFRDRNSFIVSVESRWRLARFVEGAVFHDVGRVAGSRGELGFSDAKHSTGVGVRLHSDTRTLIRLDVAHGAEGTRLNLGARQSF